MALRNALILVAAIAVAVVPAACGSAGGGNPLAPAHKPSPAPVPTPVGLQTPSGGAIYLGIFASTANGGIASVENDIGRKFALDMHYDVWTQTFPALAEDGDLTEGRIPVNSWNCNPTNAQIAAGSADPLIETRALAIKTYGRPVFLRYLWDMNTSSTLLSRGPCYDPSTDNPDGTFSATEFVAAWTHIRAIFAMERVTNVVWVWSPSASGSNPLPYYPGSALVDWIGIDAYDTTGQGFSATFAPIYAQLEPLGKPILVTETGELPADQSAFFAGAGSALQTQFPAIKGFMYYDSTTRTQNWTLTSPGIAALAAFGAEPYVSATP